MIYLKNSKGIKPLQYSIPSKDKVKERISTHLFLISIYKRKQEILCDAITMRDYLDYIRCKCGGCALIEDTHDYGFTNNLFCNKCNNPLYVTDLVKWMIRLEASPKLKKLQAEEATEEYKESEMLVQNIDISEDLEDGTLR